MASKTVTIPSKIISSLPIGFILTLIIFILIHYFGKWLYNTSPDYSNTSMDLQLLFTMELIINV
jgi:hypothetical protein